MDKGYYCSSEDEDLWQEDDPVINCLAFGWLEGIYSPKLPTLLLIISYEEVPCV